MRRKFKKAQIYFLRELLDEKKLKGEQNYIFGEKVKKVFERKL